MNWAENGYNARWSARDDEAQSETWSEETMPFALLVVAGEREGETFPIPEDRALTIGRDASNDIRLFDRKLSRIHCQVEIIGGRCQVTDLNSTNGTLVQEARIESETPRTPAMKSRWA